MGTAVPAVTGLLLHDCVKGDLKLGSKEGIKQLLWQGIPAALVNGRHDLLSGLWATIK